PALRHRCYRGSLPATGALVWMLLQNRWRGTYQTLVSRYIALTEFAASRLIEGGLPRERITVKSNFVGDIPNPGAGDGGYAVYVGRLSEEKGLRTLISAWKFLPRVPLKILGDGPLRQELIDLAIQQNLPVEFLGFCDRSTIIDTIGRAVLQVVPSECYEGFPMVVLEAYACGTPVVCSRIGSLNEIVEEGVTGVKFDPGNPRDLAAKIQLLWDDAGRRRSMRGIARATFDNKFTASSNLAAIMAIYETTIRTHTHITR
ncbi:MAG: glycosyltransferase family 4 protein, partial [Nitrospirota bacterium]|nr:glycosyltransferase family 4 protein [Nitrospirota bacterium]